MSREPVTVDDLDEMVLGPQPPRTRAEILQRWADDPNPRDEVLQADLLIAAAGEWHLVGEHARSVECCRRAVELGRCEEYGDPRTHLHAALMDAGLVDEAAELERTLRREPPSEAHDFCRVGETYEEHGDLRTAARWFTIGLDRDPDDELLAVGRFRVRRAAGLPLDAIDEETLEDFPDIADHLMPDGA